MVIDRRKFLAAGLVSFAVPDLLVAASYRPSVLGTWQDADGNHRMGYLDSGLSLPLPGRAHDIEVSTDGRTAYVLARRPGRFVVKIDLQTWGIEGVAWAPSGRHFCGHATLSTDEGLLYVTENDYESGLGRIGIYEVSPRLKRVGDLPSYGIGPHDIRRWVDGKILVVANGGIKTHPNFGTKKLNLDTMASSVVLIDPNSGYLLTDVRPPSGWRLMSMRHMDITSAGLIGLGMQWEGNGTSPPLVATWDGSTHLTFVDELSYENLSLAGYVGSVSFDQSGLIIAATSPKGGIIALWEIAGLRPIGTVPLTDVCGLCAGDGERSFIVTSGSGFAMSIKIEGTMSTTLLPNEWKVRMWDNHLTRN